MGLESALGRADFIEGSPLYEVNAAIVRMLYHLWQGNSREADRWKERVELLNVEGARPQGSDGAHLIRELPAYVAMENLTRVRQALEPIAAMAATLDGWKPVLHWARAEYERIRGDLPAALREIERALALSPPEGHSIWADAAGAHLKILMALGRHEQVREIGPGYLQTAEARRVGHWTNGIAMPLAVAHALGKDAAAAVAMADSVVAYYENEGSKGINPFLAHEARARVAAILGDWDERDRQVALCKGHIPPGGRGSLTAKYERIVRETSRDGAASSGHFTQSSVVDFTMTRTRLMSVMSSEPSAEVRASKCLELILEASGAREGYLFVVQDGEAVFAAQIAERELPPRVKSLALRFLESELSEDTTTTAGENAAKDESEWQHDASVYRPMVIGHHQEHGFDVIGLAVLRTDAKRAFRYPNDIVREIAGILALHDAPESRRMHG
jgi:hypothetical protein